MEKLLYVDDEETNLLLFKLNFGKTYEVITASSPLKVLDIILQYDIKVVIADYKMPEMNGIQLIDLIKETRPEVVCMILSGYLESEVLTDKSKVFQYIMKPYKKQEVIEILEDAYSRLAG